MFELGRRFYQAYKLLLLGQGLNGTAYSNKKNYWMLKTFIFWGESVMKIKPL
jgi:hypothetical protein